MLAEKPWCSKYGGWNTEETFVPEDARNLRNTPGWLSSLPGQRIRAVARPKRLSPCRRLEADGTLPAEDSSTANLKEHESAITFQSNNLESIGFKCNGQLSGVMLTSERGIV